MIGIVDTGGANLASLQNAFQRIGVSSFVSSDKADLDRATHLILPGVGHAKVTMEKLKKHNLISYLKNDKRPILGICLGLQILYSHLEEGENEGLGLLPGYVKQLKAKPNFNVPHMGWSDLKILKSDSLLLKDIPEDSFFYFVHSFETPMNEFVTATSTDPYPVSAILEFNNFFGVQFHPEKSGCVGEKLLKNFINLNSNKESNS